MEEEIENIAEYLAKDISESSYADVEQLKIKIRISLKLLISKGKIGEKNNEITRLGKEIQRLENKLSSLKPKYQRHARYMDVKCDFWRDKCYSLLPNEEAIFSCIEELKKKEERCGFFSPIISQK